VQEAGACGPACWSDGVTRRRVDSLRELTADERTVLEEVSRARQEPASHVARAKALLAVAAGQSYVAAAHGVGRQNGDWVRTVVVRFNREGLAALQPGHGGGPGVRYGAAEQARIVAEARRPPQRDADGTAVWSLTTLQRALRRAPDGLPTISTYTIWWVLRDAGWSWQRSRTWCDTGTVQRKRKAGTVTVIDPDAAAKKN
jgi:transposase